MTGHVIDARNLFRSAFPTADAASDVQQQWTERSVRQKREADELREHLNSIGRLDVSDRKILVRNLGRAIERTHPHKPTQIVSKLFRSTYGDEGGASREKKRKRYIRFDGEPLNEHGPGDEYAAKGQEYRILVEKLAELLEPASPKESARDRLLLSVCDGVSFYGPSRPRLPQDIGLFDRFRQTVGSLIDRIVRETDVVDYLDDIQNYNVRTHPETKDDCAPEVLANLHRQTLPVERFEYLPDGDNSHGYDEYSRLRLGGFDIRAEEPSALYPRMRLARVYWPRQMLCLPASVATSVLEQVRERPLSRDEIAEALQSYDPNPLLDEAGGDIQYAVAQWRKRQEYDLWLSALHVAGFDPDNMDWASFEDKTDGTALNGAQWRTFWQSTSIDLHLVADGKADALHLGLSFGGDWWTAATTDLVQPADDGRAGADIQCLILDEDLHEVPWLPAGDRTYVCRGFIHDLANRADDELDVGKTVEFDDLDPPILHQLRGRRLWPFQNDTIWRFLNMRLKNWQAYNYVHGTSKRQEDSMPSLRPLFDAPSGWTPAPDGSLASAILRSLAYGEESERLDEKFIMEVNKLVCCLRDMKGGLSQSFEAALSDRGYRSKS